MTSCFCNIIDKNNILFSFTMFYNSRTSGWFYKKTWRILYTCFFSYEKKLRKNSISTFGFEFLLSVSKISVGESCWNERLCLALSYKSTYYTCVFIVRKWNYDFNIHEKISICVSNFSPFPISSLACLNYFMIMDNTWFINKFWRNRKTQSNLWRMCTYG